MKYSLKATNISWQSAISISPLIMNMKLFILFRCSIRVVLINLKFYLHLQNITASTTPSLKAMLSFILVATTSVLIDGIDLDDLTVLKPKGTELIKISEKLP